MLVDSHRYRPGDIEQWDRNETADLLMARSHSRRLESLADRAADVIEGVVGRDCYVSVSWGKDSIVALDLALAVRPDIQVVHILQGSCANPDDLLVRDEALSRWPLRYTEIPWPTDIEYTWDAWCTQCATAAEYGTRITGIRAEESSARRMSAAVHGTTTDATCRPILHWTQAEVWQWIARRDLPVHPVYAMTLGGVIPRASLRVGGLLDYDQEESTGTGFGRLDWERAYYGANAARSYHRWHGRNGG